MCSSKDPRGAPDVLADELFSKRASSRSTRAIPKEDRFCPTKKSLPLRYLPDTLLTWSLVARIRYFGCGVPSSIARGADAKFSLRIHV